MSTVTSLIPTGWNDDTALNFFYQCKQLCRQGKAIILVANVGNEPPESRRGGVSLGDGHPLFDIHLRLRLKAVAES